MHILPNYRLTTVRLPIGCRAAFNTYLLLFAKHKKSPNLVFVLLVQLSKIAKVSRSTSGNGQLPLLPENSNCTPEIFTDQVERFFLLKIGPKI